MVTYRVRGSKVLSPLCLRQGRNSGKTCGGQGGGSGSEFDQITSAD
jgi:hypothetical protein